eukprot:scaffold70693_cov20-Tisochrysis_lutea.AAC.3
MPPPIQKGNAAGAYGRGASCQMLGALRSCSDWDAHSATHPRQLLHCADVRCKNVKHRHPVGLECTESCTFPAIPEGTLRPKELLLYALSQQRAISEHVKPLSGPPEQLCILSVCRGWPGVWGQKAGKNACQNGILRKLSPGLPVQQQWLGNSSGA